MAIPLKQAEHPNFDSRFNLALAVCVPAAIVGLIFALASLGTVLVFVGALVLMVWLVLSVSKANLVANSVRVSQRNFPEIFAIYQEVKHKLDYHSEVPIYIINEGSVNALVASFFRTKFIVLNAGLVAGMQGKNKLQMTWIIARFIGALKAKHFRTDFLRILIESVEKLQIFNLFILPYERAAQYTGDNIGLLVCEDVEQVLSAFNKFLVGNDLAPQIEFDGLMEQARDIRGNLFAVLARLGSPHPHQIDRYLNLIAFAEKYFPSQLEAYLHQHDQAQTLKRASLPFRYR